MLDVLQEMVAKAFSAVVPNNAGLLTTLGVIVVSVLLGALVTAAKDALKPFFQQYLPWLLAFGALPALAFLYESRAAGYTLVAGGAVACMALWRWPAMRSRGWWLASAQLLVLVTVATAAQKWAPAPAAPMIAVLFFQNESLPTEREGPVVKNAWEVFGTSLRTALRHVGRLSIQPQQMAASYADWQLTLDEARASLSARGLYPDLIIETRLRPWNDSVVLVQRGHDVRGDQVLLSFQYRRTGPIEYYQQLALRQVLEMLPSFSGRLRLSEMELQGACAAILRLHVDSLRTSRFEASAKRADELEASVGTCPGTAQLATLLEEPLSEASPQSVELVKQHELASELKWRLPSVQ